MLALLALWSPSAFATPAEADRLRGRARTAMERKDYKEAADLLERAVKADPSKPAILKDLAVVLASDQRIDESVAKYKQYLAKVPGDDAAALALATTLTWSKSKDQIKEGEQLLSEYIAKHPNADDALLQRARARSWTGQGEGAEADYRAYLAKHPNDGKVKLELAQALSARKDPKAFAAAIAIYDQHLAANPQDMPIVLQRGRVHGWAGQIPEAITDFRAYLKTKPDDEAVTLEFARVLAQSKKPEDVTEGAALLDKQLQRHPDDVDALLARARARSWSGQRPQAIADYRAYAKLVEAGAIRPPAVVDERASFELGLLLTQQSASKESAEHKEGLALMDAYAQKHPDDQEARTLLERARAGGGGGGPVDPKAAADRIATLRAFVLAHPDDEKARLDLAQALSSVRDKAMLMEAIAIYDRSIAAHPDDVALRLQRGRVRGWAGLTKEALEDFNAFVAKNPQDDAVKLEIANVLSQSADPAAALPFYDEYIAKHPESTDAKARRARVLLWTGNYARAETAIEEARALATTDDAKNDLDVDLANLYAQTGRRNEAADLLDEVLARKPDHVEAQKALERVSIYLGARLDPQLFYYFDKAGIVILSGMVEGRAPIVRRRFGVLGDISGWSLGTPKGGGAAGETLGAGRANLGVWGRVKFLDLEAAAGPRIYERFSPNWGMRARAAVAPVGWLSASLDYQYDDIYFDMLQPASISAGIRGHALHLTAGARLPFRTRITGRVGSRLLVPDNKSFDATGTILFDVVGPLSVGYNVQYITWDYNDSSYWSPQAFAAHLGIVRLSQTFNKVGFGYEVQGVLGAAGERIQGAPEAGFGLSFGASGALLYQPTPRVLLRLTTQYAQTVRSVPTTIGGSTSKDIPAPTTQLSRYWWNLGTLSATVYF